MERFRFNEKEASSLVPKSKLRRLTLTRNCAHKLCVAESEGKIAAEQRAREEAEKRVAAESAEESMQKQLANALDARRCAEASAEEAWQRESEARLKNVALEQEAITYDLALQQAQTDARAHENAFAFQQGMLQMSIWSQMQIQTQVVDKCAGKGPPRSRQLLPPPTPALPPMPASSQHRNLSDERSSSSQHRDHSEDDIRFEIVQVSDAEQDVLVLFCEGEEKKRTMEIILWPLGRSFRLPDVQLHRRFRHRPHFRRGCVASML